MNYTYFMVNVRHDLKSQLFILATTRRLINYAQNFLLSQVSRAAIHHFSDLRFCSEYDILQFNLLTPVIDLDCNKRYKSFESFKRDKLIRKLAGIDEQD